MAITGNLRTMQLSELLQWLSMGQKTGTLVVRGIAGEKRIYFQGGRIISSSSTIEREYLGSFLVAFGYISEEELTRAMQVQNESKILLGKILVMIGAIDQEDLTDLIKLKAAETIYDIFLWTEGAFEFIDGEIPKMPMIPISADVTGIVMEGLRRYDEWQRIKTRISSLRLIPAVTTPLNPGELPDRERLIVQAMDGELSIQKLAELTHNAEFHVAKLVYDLLDSGHVVIAGEEPEPILEAQEAAEDPFETVFEDAAVSPFDLRPEPLEDTIGFGAARERSLPVTEPSPAPPPPASQDFSRFLKRGPDSSTDSGRSSGRTFAAEVAPQRHAPAPPPSVITQPPVTAAAPSVAAPASPSAPSVAAPPASPGLTPSTALIPSNAVPTLIKPMEELMSWSFTPNEAFIVSRINGHWDVRSIVKISPFPELEVLRVFQKLHAGGVIAWR